MNAAQLVGLALNVSLALMVFSVALSAGTTRATAILRQPGLALRSFIAMFVVMPVVAVLIAKYVDLNRALLVTLLLVALSPIPPILPAKQLKTGGDPDYVFGLLALTALGAILVIPGGVDFIGRVFGRELELPFGVAARVIALSLLGPTILGLLVAHHAPGIARRLDRPTSVAGLVLLVAASALLLYAVGAALAAAMADFTVVAMIAFVAVGLAVGHLLGGPVAGNRTTLALATATRHPGVALAVMGALDPTDKTIAPVVLLYLLVSIVASAPYVAWRKRSMEPKEGRARA